MDSLSSLASRVVMTEDAVLWLNQTEIIPKASYVASLPDYSEFPGLKIHEWKIWFEQSARLILAKCDPSEVIVFYQSDILHEGEWVDKSFLCQKAAAELNQGHFLLGHKIICRLPPGISIQGRPSYSHLLYFTRNPELKGLTSSRRDVLTATGDKTWVRGMGIETCLMIAKFIKEEVKSETLVNPFCGQGSMLAAANYVGLNALGIERGTKRAIKARNLTLSSDGKRWLTMAN